MDIVTYILCKSSDKKILDLVKSMERLTMVISDHIPTVAEAEPNKLYLVDTNHDGTYEEYILAEISGVPQIIELGNITDLTDYYTKEEIDDFFARMHIQCTPAEYDALTPEQKNNGSEYFVYDSVNDVGFIYRYNHVYGSSTIEAENVIYDNTGTQISVTNVQDALTELDAELNSLFSLVSLAQYNELTPEQKNNGTVYFVSLGANAGEIYKNNKLYGSTRALKISYDNTTSNLTATDVQSALDEIVTDFAASHVQLTQAQYDALTPAEQADGTVYFVYETGADSGVIYRNGHLFSVTELDAENVNYDNTDSGLDATNVQDALDEVVDMFDGARVQLTQAEYDELTPAEQANGTTYYVYNTGDEAGVIYRNGHLFSTTELTAEDVSYDNTDSGLTADDVQEAIDELADAIVNVHESLTQAEYDALTTAEKMNGTEYFVSDISHKNGEVVQYDSNDDIISRTRIVGIIPREIIYAEDEVTVQPALIESMSEINTDPTSSIARTCLLFETEIDGKTIYHTNIFQRKNTGATQYSSLNDRYFTRFATDINASNLQLMLDHDTTVPPTLKDSFYIADENGVRLGEYGASLMGYYFVYNGDGAEGFSAVDHATVEQVEIPGERKIYRNDIVYSSVGGDEEETTPHIDLTQAQYDALTPEQKMDGTEYFITDAVAEGDFSNLETRLQKMESNFIDVSPNVTMPNPVNYKSMTKVNSNKVEIIIEDTVAHKDYKVTVTASGSGNTRTNPQYTIEEVI